MNNLNKLSILLLLLCLLSPTWGMMAQVTDQDKVGKADLVIVGTVLGTRVIPDVPFFTAGEAHVHIDRVLKGEKVDEVIVRYSAVPTLPNGTIISDHNGVTLAKDSAHLFFLQRAQGGYELVGGPQGIADPAAAAHFAALITDIPASVSFSGKAGAFYFGKRVEVHAVVRNTSKTPLTLYYVDIETFVLSPRLGNVIPMVVVEANIPGQVPTPSVAYMQPKRVEIAAGGEYQVTLQVTCNQPVEWQFLGADSYLLAQCLVRARMFVQPANDGDHIAVGSTIASPWQLSLLGYPPYDMSAKPKAVSGRPVPQVDVTSKVPLTGPIESPIY